MFFGCFGFLRECMYNLEFLLEYLVNQSMTGERFHACKLWWYYCAFKRLSTAVGCIFNFNGCFQLFLKLLFNEWGSDTHFRFFGEVVHNLGINLSRTISICPKYRNEVPLILLQWRIARECSWRKLPFRWLQLVNALPDPASMKMAVIFDNGTKCYLSLSSCCVLTLQITSSKTIQLYH